MITSIQTFSVENTARAEVASCQVALVESTSHYVKDIVELLSRHVAVWLSPFRGIPRTPSQLKFDAIYLDENHQVMQEVASFPQPGIEEFTIEPASALLLPRHTDFALHTRPGDVLAIAEALTGEERPLQPASQPSEVVSRAFDSVPGPKLVEPVLGDPLSPQHALQMEDALHRLKQSEADEQQSRPGSLLSRFLRWLNEGRDPSDRRAATRKAIDGLFAYFWTGGAPTAIRVTNISDQGLYLLTPERPPVGTIVLMVIQRMDSRGNHPVDTVALHAEVARWGEDGVGFFFLMPRLTGDAKSSIARSSGWDEQALKEFLARLNQPLEDLEQKISA